MLGDSCCLFWRTRPRAEDFLSSVLFRFLSQPFQVFNGSCDREGPENGVNTTALLHWELTCDAL